MGHKSNEGITTGSDVSGNQIKNYSLRYLDANEPIGDTVENDADFIKDIDSFKRDLPIIQVAKVELAQC